MSIEWLWDLHQEQRIIQLEQQAGFVKGDAQASAQAALMNIIVPLERRVEKLNLICRAMWVLLREKTDVTDEELSRKITELDALDGNIDGRLVRQPMKCPKCDSMVARAFNRCLFCGYEPPANSPFDSV